MNLLGNLPPELLIHAFSFLDIDSIHACEKTCTVFQSLIRQSPVIQYAIECGLASVVDNPAFPLDSVSDRLPLLRARDSAFARRRPSWTTEMRVPFAAAGLYELTGGLFWLGEKSRKALNWTQLPIEPEEKPEWRRLQVVGENETSVIIDFGLAVEEADLLLVAKYSWTGSDSSSGYITLHPYCISTSQPHPLAKGPIDVMESHTGQPRVTIEIVGDVLVFIVGFNQFGWNAPPNPENVEPDRVFVYEWKTGALRREISAPSKTYYGLAFVTPDIIMLPNAREASLELWNISRSASDWIAPILALQLPYLHHSASIRYFTTRCEPNPAVYASKGSASRFPFSPDPVDTIAVFHITLHFPDAENGGNASVQYLLFMHRRSLLEMIEKHVRVIPGETTKPVAGPYGLSYTSWGGPIYCRWLPARGLVTDWITTTSGQRAIIVGAGPNGGPVFMFDFNVRPTHLKRRDEEDPEFEVTPEEGQEPRRIRKWIPFKPSSDIREISGLFTQPVGSLLPCYYTQIMASNSNSQNEEQEQEQEQEQEEQRAPSYTGASLDEARIVGLKRDVFRQISTVEILFFG
ncbi:hypothetical protein C8F01DRAFT_343454 [Mycena amicta]|nr:hypothetical protein C8F01DRAFT_343454 [Mycena amicta]